MTAASWVLGDGSVLAQLSERLQPHVLVRVVVPDLVQDGRTPRSRNLLEVVEDTLSNLAGGVTSYAGIGRWRDEYGVVHREPVTVVDSHLVHELSRQAKSELCDLISWLCIEGDQKAVAVAIIQYSPLFIVRRSDLSEGEAHVVSPGSLETAAGR